MQLIGNSFFPIEAAISGIFISCLRETTSPASEAGSLVKALSLFPYFTQFYPINQATALVVVVCGRINPVFLKLWHSM